MQFQVPQFIEIEDKIFGPLTLKQFIFLAGGVGMSFVIYFFIPFKIISIPLILIVIVFAIALTFWKVNSRSFVEILESAFYYYIGEKLYIWKKNNKKPEKKLQEEIITAKSILNVPKLSESKLKDITWSLDIKENLNNKTKS